MDYVIICFIAFAASLLTLFSGFGLGTVLMPVFALFFPLPVAIGATAVVHLTNNLFKALLVGKLAKWDVVLRFGIPAGIASAIGAFLLGSLANLPPLFTFHIFTVTLIGLVVGVIVIASAFFELIPKLAHLTFPSHLTPIGGFLSGFFGGVSGNQGMLRGAFLIKAGLSKEEYMAQASCVALSSMSSVCPSMYGHL